MFSLSYGIFWWIISNFYQVSYFPIVVNAFCVLLKKSFSKYIPVLSSKSYIFSPFMFKSVISLELIFVPGMWGGAKLPFSIWIPNCFSTHFWKDHPFPAFCSTTFVLNQVYMHGSVSVVFVYSCANTVLSYLLWLYGIWVRSRAAVK